jgi:hypothetical protein
MVLGSIGRLTSTAIRGLARNLFSGFYERGLSANQALTELRGAGLGYRRQNFLDDYRAERPGFDKSTSAGRIGSESMMRESLLKPEYHGVPDKYSFVFKQTGLDPNTGEVREEYFYYHRNTLDKKGNLEGDATDWADEQAGRYSMDTTSVRLVAGYINPAWA